MSVVREGWIEKKGQTFLAGYKKRWLVLYSDDSLKYYEDHYYEILKGSIDLSTIKTCRNSKEHSPSWVFGFELLTPKRTWQFSCKTNYDRQHWIKALRTQMNYPAKKAAATANSNKHNNHNHNNASKDSILILTPNTNTDNITMVKARSDATLSPMNEMLELNVPKGMSMDSGNDSNHNNTNNAGTLSSRSIQQTTTKRNSANMVSKFGRYNSAIKRHGNEEYAHVSDSSTTLRRTSASTLMTESASGAHFTLNVALHQQLQRKRREAAERGPKCWLSMESLKREMSTMDLVCYCTGHLQETQVTALTRLECEFCGTVQLPKGASYYACDDGANNVHIQGWEICCKCLYQILVTKYYDPESEEPRKVGIRIHVDRVSHVDTATQSFRAKVVINTTWKPTKEEVSAFEADPWGFRPSWRPAFDFPNMVEVHDEHMKQTHFNTEYTILKKGDSNSEEISPVPYIITGSYEIDATFSEVFELENFPVDCQDLTIKIQSAQYTAMCVFTQPFQGRHMLSMLQEYSTIPEWKLHEPKFETFTRKNGPVVEYSAINVSLKLSREPLAIFVRIILFMMLLTSSALIAFSIDPIESGPDRIAYLITLLLTAVGYQFVILSDLPAVSYLTLMDKYILKTFLFIFAMLIETSLVTSTMFQDSEYNAKFDRWCLYGFGGVFVFAQFFFGVKAMRARRYELGKLGITCSSLAKYTLRRRRKNLMQQFSHGKTKTQRILPGY